MEKLQVQLTKASYYLPSLDLLHVLSFAMTTESVTTDIMTDIMLSALSSPEPDSQRGRKRRRSPPPYIKITTTHSPSGESATFRGRSRRRSISRLDTSRTASRLRSGSLSPTRKRLLKVLQLNRHRSQSPSRSRSRNNDEASKRRRQRTKSRSREHPQRTKGLEQSLLCQEIIILSEGLSVAEKQHG